MSYILEWLYICQLFQKNTIMSTNTQNEKEEVKDQEELLENDTNESSEDKASDQNENDSDGESDESPSSENDYKDKFVRLYSEFENYRKRTAKEKIELIKTASSDLAKEILAIVDDLERAIKANESIEGDDGLKEGYVLIYNKFLKILDNKGIKEIECLGESFDVDKHEALTQVPAQSDDQKGKVIDVIEKGYMMGDTIIRYAKVVVGQ